MSGRGKGGRGLYAQEAHNARALEEGKEKWARESVKPRVLGQLPVLALTLHVRRRLYKKAKEMYDADKKQWELDWEARDPDEYMYYAVGEASTYDELANTWNRFRDTFLELAQGALGRELSPSEKLVEEWLADYLYRTVYNEDVTEDAVLDDYQQGFDTETIKSVLLGSVNGIPGGQRGLTHHLGDPSLVYLLQLLPFARVKELHGLFQTGSVAYEQFDEDENELTPYAVMCYESLRELLALYVPLRERQGQARAAVARALPSVVSQPAAAAASSSRPSAESESLRPAAYRIPAISPAEKEKLQRLLDACVVTPPLTSALATFQGATPVFALPTFEILHKPLLQDLFNRYFPVARRRRVQWVGLPLTVELDGPNHWRIADANQIWQELVKLLSGSAIGLAAARALTFVVHSPQSKHVVLHFHTEEAARTVVGEVHRLHPQMERLFQSMGRPAGPNEPKLEPLELVVVPPKPVAASAAAPAPAPAAAASSLVSDLKQAADDFDNLPPAMIKSLLRKAVEELEERADKKQRVDEGKR